MLHFIKGTVISVSALSAFTDFARCNQADLSACGPKSTTTSNEAKIRRKIHHKKQDDLERMQL